MQRPEFFEQAVLAVLPACTSYGLNGLNEAIQHEEEQLSDMPPEAIARRVLGKLPQLQEGMIKSVIANTIALASAITESVESIRGATVAVGSDDSELEERKIRHREVADAHADWLTKQKQEAQCRGSNLQAQGQGMAEGKEVPPTFCSQDGKGLSAELAHNFCTFLTKGL